MGNVSNSYFWNALCISQILKIGTFPVITFSLKGPVKGVFFSLKVWDSILTTGKVLCRHSQALCSPKIFSHSSLESVGKVLWSDQSCLYKINQISDIRWYLCTLASVFGCKLAYQRCNKEIQYRCSFYKHIGNPFDTPIKATAPSAISYRHFP